MKPRIILKLLMAFALCTGIVSLADDARAEIPPSFSVIMDCHGDGGIPEWATSRGPIVVSAKVNGVWFELGSGPIPNCDVDDQYSVGYQGFSVYDVTSIKVHNQGSDMLFLDKISLAETFLGLPEDIVVTWGIDNNTGYCISAEVEDPNPHCWQGQSYSTLTYSW